MKLKLLIITLLTTSLNLFGQVRTISGIVTDASDGLPLPGVNVIVQGTNKGTSSDANGKFTLTLDPGENNLSFTYIGYQPKTIEIGNQSNISITLEEDAAQLDEIIVVGYGTVKKSDLTGSVSSIKASDLTNVPSNNAMQALQAKVAGVQVASTSGAPGASVYVRIRGIGTFNDASPIYVVDGVILQNIDYLNPSDITSFEVLKDASATAIYGARGANGVILITTKKGSTTGSNYPKIEFTSEVSIQDLPKKIDLLNGRQYAITRNAITPGTYNNIDAVPNTDWQDLIFRAAPIQNHQVSASGGNEKHQYFTSFGYFNQTGIVLKSGYERITMRFNNSYNLSKAIRFGSNLSITPSKQQNTAGGAVFNVYRAWPTLKPYQSDGSFTPVPGVGNVLADIKYSNNTSKSIRSVNNVYAEVDFLKGFTFRSSLGVDFEYSKSVSYTPVFYVNTTQQNATDDLNKGYFDRTDWLWENTLTYKKEIGKHRVDILTGYTMQESSSETVNLGAQSLLRPGEDFWYVNIFPNLPSPNSAYNGVDPYFNFSMLSYLFRANYAWNNKYLFTATFRRDGSSKFVEQNRYANFPSIALGWNVINESFLENIELISNLKVRASWGILGNEKIPYLRQYSLVSNGINAVFGPDALYAGATYGISGNPDLKWESTTQTDIGLELGLWNDRLTAEIDFYNRVTEDILIDLSVPGYQGNGDGALITFNAGQVLNRGFEVNLGYNGKIKDVSYRIGLVGTTIHNETLAVRGTSSSDDELIGLFNGRQVTRTKVGDPIGSFYGYKVNGVFQNNSELNAYPHLSNTGVGDLRFVDTNDDGILNARDRTNLGSPIPKFLAGLNGNATYKAFSISFNLQAQAGNKIYNGKETVRPDPYNFEQRYFNFWDGEGSSNSEPKAANGGVNFENPSERYIYSGSFLRLRNLSVGYKIPRAITEKVKMQSADIYLRATNLFTISKFTGYSPEIVNGNPILNGIDFASYPVARITSIGINFSF